MNSRLCLKFYIGCHMQRCFISLIHVHFVILCSDKPTSIADTFCFLFLGSCKCFCPQDFLLKAVCSYVNSNQREICASLILTIVYTCLSSIILFWRSILYPLYSSGNPLPKLKTPHLQQRWWGQWHTDLNCEAKCDYFIWRYWVLSRNHGCINTSENHSLSFF